MEICALLSNPIWGDGTLLPGGMTEMTLGLRSLGSDWTAKVACYLEESSVCSAACVIHPWVDCSDRDLWSATVEMGLSFVCSEIWYDWLEKLSKRYPLANFGAGYKSLNWSRNMFDINAKEQVRWIRKFFEATSSSGSPIQVRKQRVQSMLVSTSEFGGIRPEILSSIRATKLSL